MITTQRRLGTPDFQLDNTPVKGEKFIVLGMDLNRVAGAFAGCKPTTENPTYTKLWSDLQALQVRLDRLSNYDANGADYKMIVNAIDSWCVGAKAFLGQTNTASGATRQGIFRVFTGRGSATTDVAFGNQLREAIDRMGKSAQNSVTHRYFDAPDVGFEAAYA